MNERFQFKKKKKSAEFLKINKIIFEQHNCGALLTGQKIRLSMSHAICFPIPPPPLRRINNSSSNSDIYMLLLLLLLFIVRGAASCTLLSNNITLAAGTICCFDAHPPCRKFPHQLRE